jgi:Predicted integral membrane protein (DUF2269)
VSLYEWLLFLHVLAAFLLVAALVVFWTIGVVARKVDRPSESLRYFRVAMPANVLVGIGTVGTLIFGVWLAIERDEYQVWDGWVLGAIILWAIATELGRRAGTVYAEAAKLAARLSGEGRGDEPNVELRTLLQDRRAMVLQALSSLGTLLILIDMIYKPGA